jgi:pilus assembly protein CpaC
MLSRAATAIVVAFAVAGVLPVPAGAAEPAVQTFATMGSRTIKLQVSKSMIVDFPADIRDILVADPKVADAVVRTSRRLYLLGNKFGTTTITVFGANGAPLGDLQIVIQPDAPTLEALLKKIMPQSRISVETANDTVILRGEADNPQDAVTAYNVANKFLGKKSDSATTTASAGTSVSVTNSTGDSAKADDIQVLNLIKIKGKDQVMLKVTIAEVQREALKALGVNLQAALTGSVQATLATSNEFTNSTGVINNVATLGNTAFRGSTIEALEQHQVMKMLAEPTLTAISGEEANFVAGGEYPVPVSSNIDNGVRTVGIEFKKFGIKLNFIPVVLTEGRISLKVATEVSELTNEGAITLSGTKISALKTRQATTTLEMPSGGTMVLAGLIKDDVRQALSGSPGLMNLPVLGTLFRSKDFKRQQTELAIFIQPLIVQPVAAAKLVRPDQNFQPPSDASGFFLGRVNRMYRTAAEPGTGTYHGQYGFIYD